MELTMNQAVLGVERSGIRVFTQLARQTPGCMALTLGEPDFDTAPAIRAAAKAALELQGYDVGEPNAPLPRMSQAQKQAFWAALREKGFPEEY